MRDLGLVVKDGQHFYEDGEGLSLPSVSTVLSVLNDDDWNRMRGGIGNRTADAILDEAGGIGTQIHRIIARLTTGDNLDEWYSLDGRIRNAVKAYERFRKQVHYHPRRAETPVRDLSSGYAGTEDQDGDIPAGHIILELKSGKPKLWDPIQLGAYCGAHLATFKREKLIGGCVVYLDKETGFPHPRFYTDVEIHALWRAFLSLLDTYNALEEIRQGGTQDQWKLKKTKPRMKPQEH